MSKHEMIRALKDAQFRGQFAGAQAVNPAAVSRRAAQVRNMKMMTNLKAGARAASGPNCPVYTSFC